MTERNRDQLCDALRGCLDWIEENCGGDYPYCVFEARAALRGIHVAHSADGEKMPPSVRATECVCCGQESGHSKDCPFGQ
jgi:hypothetical protein